MNAPPIAYLEPLATAWTRTKDLLFRPFDIMRLAGHRFLGLAGDAG